ncbi:porin [Pedobacter rhodius]|uniref:Porin n=1 Tax=Pedobacter rhodius TaxID=3004098 RepID=A0ABT4L1P2_9SPHI|nr:porin [Pedobacter sp. SJ11]MCZ4225097.1 porin [Pedobacter sp. SJ11]
MWLKNKNYKGFKTILLILLVSSVLMAKGQTGISSPNVADTVSNPLGGFLKGLRLSGLIRSRFVSSFDKNIDIDGIEHAAGITGYANNAFNVPQARLAVSGDVTSKLDVYFRANFADFSKNPQGKVLEYAYATYHFNPYLNIRMGLFRPYFGREDDISTDFLKSFDYSNQYTVFDENGWMNYQMGISVAGVLKDMAFPVKYYIGIYNGNRRNGFTDNDNGKQFPARVELDFNPDFQVGLNGGLGKEYGNRISVWGVDVYYKKQIDQRLRIDVVTEYKQGSNQSLFFSEAIPGKKIGDYQLQGLYVLPSLFYELKGSTVKGLEASFKYEYLNPSVRQHGNVHQQYVPMFGIDFAAQSALRLQVGAVLDRYDHNVENSSLYDASRFITQLQIRF